MKYKHYYEGKPLSYYCKEHGYLYKSIYQRYRYQEKKDSNKIRNKQEKIKEALERYLKKKHLIDVRNAFFRLKNEPSSCKRNREICDVLKIDYKRIQRLIYKGYQDRKIILIVWYYSDIDKNGLKSISQKQLSMVNKLTREDMKNDLYQLICHYHMGDESLIDEIINYESPIFNKIVTKMIKKYRIPYDLKDDLHNEACYQFIRIINNLVTDNIAQMITYLDLSIRGYLIRYIKVNYETNIEYDEKRYYKKVQAIYA